MYSTIAEVDMILAQALTTAKPNTTSPVRLVNIGNERDLNRVPDDTVNQYIRYADSQINSVISQQYQVPLKECQYAEEHIVDSCEAGSNIIVVATVPDLAVGDKIIIRCEARGLAELHTVTVITGNTTITLDSDILTMCASPYDCAGMYIAKYGYPWPINQISSRYAASFIYDKYFSAQADPNVSNYGKEMRNIAMGQLNDILNGRTILNCQRRIGDRFGNPWLDSSYSHRTPVDGYNTGERNMSKIT